MWRPCGGALIALVLWVDLSGQPEWWNARLPSPVSDLLGNASVWAELKLGEPEKTDFRLLGERLARKRSEEFARWLKAGDGRALGDFEQSQRLVQQHAVIELERRLQPDQVKRFREILVQAEGQRR